MRNSTFRSFAVAFILLGSLVSASANAQQLLLEREVGSPLLIMQVTGEDSVISPGPQPILSTRYVLQVTNNTGTVYECDGKIAFYDAMTGSTSAFPVTATARVPTGGPWIVVQTDVRSDTLLGFDRNGTTVSCTPSSTGGGGGGSGGGGTPGNPMMVGNVSYTVTPSMNEATLGVQTVTNPSSARTTGTLRIELWATSAPYSGGTLSGARMAVARVPESCGANSQLAPGVSCGPITETTSYSAPSPGSYTAVMLLTEFGDGDTCPTGEFCITDWLNFTNEFIVQPEPPTSSGGLEMTGSFSYNVNFDEDAVTFNVNQVANTSLTRTSGTLRFELWAMSQPYQGQISITGYRFFKGDLPSACGLGNGQLGPEQSCSQVQLSGTVDNKPPAGTYYVAAFLNEHDSNSCTSADRFCIAVGRAFPNQITVSADATPPPNGGGGAPPPPSDGGGGGVFDAFALGGILALAAACRSRRENSIRRPSV